MAIDTEWIRYGENNRYSGFAARAARAAAPLPAVVVIQEVFGVDAHIEDITRRVAAAGYFAFAPDLYAVDGVRPPLFTRERMTLMQKFFDVVPSTSWMDPAKREAAVAAWPKADGDAIRETFAAGLSVELTRYLPQLLATTAFLRRDHEPTRSQKQGVMGFCLGGGLSGLLACHDAELAAAAIFYGMPPATALVANVRCPVIAFYAGEDKRINDALPAFTDALKAAGKSFESHVYAGAAHAFFNDNRPPYHVAAARDAWARLLGHLRQHVG